MLTPLSICSNCQNRMVSVLLDSEGGKEYSCCMKNKQPLDVAVILSCSEFDPIHCDKCQHRGTDSDVCTVLSRKLVGCPATGFTRDDACPFLPENMKEVT